MRIAVLGAGITGVTTAYYLSGRGHQVTVIERGSVAATGASAQNGGQLSYSFTDAMANPTFLGKMPSVLSGRDPAFMVRAGWAHGLVPWGLDFLRQCTAEKSCNNTLAVLRLAMRSARLMRKLRETVPLDFSFRSAGKLVMLETQEQAEAASAMVKAKRKAGCALELIGLKQALEIEPALAGFRRSFAAAIWSPEDEVGDTRAFTRGLADWLIANRSVRFQMDTDVRGLRLSGGSVVAVETDGHDIECDAVVVCMGAWSRKLLLPLGLKLKIYPVRGYSLTLPAGPAPASVSITDQSAKMVYSRLNGQVRIAGFADLTGFDDRHDERRVQTLLERARECAPEIADYSAADCDAWTGLRPMTPDSRPRVGSTAVGGLYLNTGHGMLGWTLACATAEQVANGISGSA